MGRWRDAPTADFGQPPFKEQFSTQGPFVPASLDSFDRDRNEPLIPFCSPLILPVSFSCVPLYAFSNRRSSQRVSQEPMNILPKATAPQPFSVRTALIVDRDPEIDAVLGRVLDARCWAIQYAPDNPAALLMVQKRNFDLIVTSQKTSGQEDVDLLRRIRRVRPHTRLIILTDGSTPADVIASMRERAFSYFSKPFSPDTLAAMISIAADGPAWDDGIEIISATPEWIRLLVRCDLKSAERVLQFLAEFAELPDPEKHDVGVASREMLLNAIEHGGKFDPEQRVEIGYVRARHMVTCRITDPGPGFTLDEIPHASVANPPENPLHHLAHREALGMRPGGFGVLLTQNLVHELIYNQNGNDVILVKYIGSGIPATNAAGMAAGTPE
jgi:DNA-binding response OmpR family regulator